MQQRHWQQKLPQRRHWRLKWQLKRLARQNRRRVEFGKDRTDHGTLDGQDTAALPALAKYTWRTVANPGHYQPLSKAIKFWDTTMRSQQWCAWYEPKPLTLLSIWSTWRTD
eukprot:15589817-Heterocapsa_arctica.AAC.1